MLLQVLNSVFDGCNIEAYNYWIKKRVLVFEYGRQGKIKLGIEPLTQAGALIDLRQDKCKFHQICPAAPHAIMLFETRENPLKIALIIAQKQFTIADARQLTQAFSCLHQFLNDRQYKIFAIISTETKDDQALKLLQDNSLTYHLFNYDTYIGREVEQLFV